MTDAVKPAPSRGLPLMAGRFGEFSLADRLGEMAHRPVGCPSIDQFETRMAVVPPPVPDRR